jgi:RND superfamily putative drug exporter
LSASHNIAARAGRWSAQHRKSAILGWIPFVVLATVVGGKVGTNQLKDSASGNGEDPGVDGYSRDLAVMKTYDRIQAAFPGGAVQSATVIKAKDVTTPEVKAAIAQLHDKAIATGQLSEPSGIEISPDKTVAVVGLSVNGSGTDAASNESVRVLREEVAPTTVGKLPGADVAVTGLTAGSKDFNNVMKSRLPLVFGFVLSLAFILLLVTFRSIVVPLKAIVLNLLSVGAA